MATKNSNWNENGMLCTCPNECHASKHRRKPMDRTIFVDKHGKRIKHGDTLKYVNPKFPDRHQPLINILENEGDIYVVVKDQVPMKRTSWQSPERFEIVT